MPTMIDNVIKMEYNIINYLKNNNVIYHTNVKDLDTDYDYYVFEYDKHNERINFKLYWQYVPISSLYIREDFEDEVYYLYDNQQEYFNI